MTQLEQETLTAVKRAANKIAGVDWEQRRYELVRDILLRGEKTDRHVIVAALFVSNDDSSPLRLVTNRFTAWDVYDYLDAEDIEHLLNRI